MYLEIFLVDFAGPQPRKISEPLYIYAKKV